MISIQMTQRSYHICETPNILNPLMDFETHKDVQVCIARLETLLNLKVPTKNVLSSNPLLFTLDWNIEIYKKW